jgi:hypothetical protein
VSAIILSSIFVLIGCIMALNRGLTWSILPLGITTFVWLAMMLGFFVLGKNKISSLLLCGFIIFLTTFYYSSLNQAQTRDIGTYGVFNGFQNAYIPHYTIILLMFIVSIVLTVISLLMRNKEISGGISFLLVAGNLTIMILSVLTIPAIMDYVDIQGLGVNPKFTILLLLTFLMNCVSLALLAKRFLWQMVEKRRSGNN